MEVDTKQIDRLIDIDLKGVNDNIRMYKKWKIKMYKNEYFYIP